MRILFLALEPPYPPNDGGRIRTFNLLSHISQEHEVTLVTFESVKTPSADWTPLRAVCREIHVIPRLIIEPPTLIERLSFLMKRQPIALRHYASTRMIEMLERLMQIHQYDLMHVNELWLAQFAPAVSDIPRVMDHTDIETEKQRRVLLTDSRRYSLYWWLRWIEHLQWRSFEVRSLAWFQVHLAVSEHDARFFRRYARDSSVLVVPNGVEINSLEPRPDPDAAPTLIYVGSLDYSPNVDAVCWFVNDIWPMILGAVSDVRLIVVGRNPPPDVAQLAHHPGITVTGTVPSVRPYFEQAHAMVVPLRSGGGTRLKILEAMAAGVPVVSTSIGSEGLDVTNEVDLLLADTPGSFAEQTVHLLNNRELRTNLSTHARQTVEAHYDWRLIAKKLLSAYRLAIASYNEHVDDPV